MAPIPRAQASTVRAIYAAYEAAANSWDAWGISVGSANAECDRAIWFSFRWASKQEPRPGRILRLFETGNIEEERLVEDLQRIGVDVYGQQDKIRLVGGHVRGKADGKAMGVPEAPKTEHLCEFKSSKHDKFKEIVKKGCKVAQPLHYGQCQLGMHAFGLTRALYLVSCKDTDELYAERIEYDVDFTLRLLARLERIINMAEPPTGVCTKPDDFRGLFCDHRRICLEQSFPRVTCRTCIHSTPEMSGDAHWSCSRWNKPLSIDEQRAACPAHLHIPSLIPGEVIEADEENETIRYRLHSGREWIDGENREVAA